MFRRFLLHLLLVVVDIVVVVEWLARVAQQRRDLVDIRGRSNRVDRYRIERWHWN